MVDLFGLQLHRNRQYISLAGNLIFNRVEKCSYEILKKSISRSINHILRNVESIECTLAISRRVRRIADKPPALVTLLFLRRANVVRTSS